MTEPLQPPGYRELLQKYDAELVEIESASSTIKLNGLEALAIITHIQIARANPAVEHNPLLSVAIAAAKQIQSTFNPESAIYQVLEIGWGSPKDVDAIGEHPHQILRSVSCRPKMLRRSPEPHISNKTTTIFKKDFDY